MALRAVRFHITPVVHLGGNQGTICRASASRCHLCPCRCTDAYRADWHQLIKGLGYEIFHKVDAFEQFECPGRPGIDLMLVHAETWEKLFPAAHQVELDQEATAKIPAVLHLIAMKLNASKNPHRRTDAADLQDVMALIKTCQIDTSSEEFTAILDRYASPEDRSAIDAMVNQP